MARFNLKDGSSLKELGVIIRTMGARIAAFGLDHEGVRERQPDAQAKFAEQVTDEIAFDDSIGEALRQGERAASQVSEGGTFVQFHFDRTIEEKGQGSYKIVNVVVNDFGNKLVTEPDGSYTLGDDGEPLCDLNGIAEESLGFIVFARCG